MVSGYKTRNLYITSVVKNNKFLVIMMSFLTKITIFLTKMTIKICYITEITIKLAIKQPNSLYNKFKCHFCVSRVILVTHKLFSLLDSIRPHQNKSCFAGLYFVVRFCNTEIKTLFWSILLYYEYKRNKRQVTCRICFIFWDESTV